MVYGKKPQPKARPAEGEAQPSTAGPDAAEPADAQAAAETSTAAAQAQAEEAKMEAQQAEEARQQEEAEVGFCTLHVRLSHFKPMEVCWNRGGHQGNSAVWCSVCMQGYDCRMTGEFNVTCIAWRTQCRVMAYHPSAPFRTKSATLHVGHCLSKPG